MTTSSVKTAAARSRKLRPTRLRKKLEYVYDPCFEAEGAQQELSRNGYLPPPYGPHIVLSREQERDLFLRFNYARYRVSKNPEWPRSWRDLVRHWKETIAWHNLPLAAKVVQKFLNTNIGFDNLLSEAYCALDNAINNFNVSKGFRFSTYAVNAMRKGMLKAIEVDERHRRVSILEVGAMDFDEQVKIDAKMDAKTIVRRNPELTRREKTLLLDRYGCDDGSEKTFRELGEKHGLSPERVRQILKSAFEKLREQYGYEGKNGNSRSRKGPQKRSQSQVKRCAIRRGFPVGL